MRAHGNAEILLEWLNQCPSATVAEMAKFAAVSSTTASDAVQYAVRNGAMERINSASTRGPKLYRSTGIPLPVPHSPVSRASFNELIQAWGITLQPPRIQSHQSCRHRISDAE